MHLAIPGKKKGIKNPGRLLATMGVRGLLAAATAVAVPCEFYRTFRGKTAGIDASVWIHTFAAVHAAAYVGKGDLKPVVAAFAKRIQTFLSRGVVPVVVFDGPAPPSKESEKEARAARLERDRERLQFALEQAMLGAPVHKGTLQRCVQLTDVLKLHIIITTTRCLSSTACVLRIPRSARGRSCGHCLQGMQRRARLSRAGTQLAAGRDASSRWLLRLLRPLQPRQTASPRVRTTTMSRRAMRSRVAAASRRTR